MKWLLGLACAVLIGGLQQPAQAFRLVPLDFIGSRLAAPNVLQLQDFSGTIPDTISSVGFQVFKSSTGYDFIVDINATGRRFTETLPGLDIGLPRNDIELSSTAANGDVFKLDLNNIDFSAANVTAPVAGSVSLYLKNSDVLLSVTKDNVTFGISGGFVPLPSAAPMFGAALLMLAGFGYAKRRSVRPLARQ